MQPPVERDALEYSWRHAESSIRLLESVRERSRAFLAMAGIALTLAAGLAVPNQENGANRMMWGFAAGALVALVAQSVIGYRINNGGGSIIPPDAGPALKGESPYAVAIALLEATSDANMDALQDRSRWLTWQVGWFVLECTLLACALALVGIADGGGAQSGDSITPGGGSGSDIRDP